jgi:metal-responsive CopG/Arc/MetJ family transcriptional regulator
MAARSAKIACSIDAELLAQVEELRAKTGETRSAVISRALVKLTSSEAHQAAVSRYAEAYREKPETQGEVAFARRGARKALASLPWDAGDAE